MRRTMGSVWRMAAVSFAIAASAWGCGEGDVMARSDTGVTPPRDGGGTRTDGGGIDTDSGGSTDGGSTERDAVAPPRTDGGPGGSIESDPNVRIAFIGDSANGSNFERVLNLIRSEGADFTMHQGDFDYAHNPDAFFATIDRILGADYPYFASAGNHDHDEWSAYASHLHDHMMAAGVTTLDDSNMNDQMYSFEFMGVKLVFVGENGNNTAFANFIDEQLSGDDHIWKVCSWHKNQRNMQIGGKTDEMGWAVYENCRRLGAIVATAHEHSYERTRTLVNMTDQVPDDSCNDPAHLCVGPGRTFAFVSGLGGNSIRDQERCLPTAFPYGCNQEWAFIYASNQGAQYGALFIDVNVDSNPRLAHGYFKTVGGDVVDEFDVTID